MKKTKKCAFMALVIFLIFGLSGCAGGPDQQAPTPAITPPNNGAKKQEEKTPPTEIKVGEKQPKAADPKAEVKTQSAPSPAPKPIAKSDEDLLRDIYSSTNGVSWCDISKYIEESINAQPSLSNEQKMMRYTECFILYVFTGVLAEFPLPQMAYVHAQVSGFGDFEKILPFGKFSNKVVLETIPKICNRDFEYHSKNKEKLSLSQLEALQRFVASPFATGVCGFDAALTPKLMAAINMEINSQRLRAMTVIQERVSAMGEKLGNPISQFLIESAIKKHWCDSHSSNAERVAKGILIPGFNRAIQILDEYMQGDYAAGQTLNSCQIPVGFVLNWDSPWGPGKSWFGVLSQYEKKKAQIMVDPVWGRLIAKAYDDPDQPVIDALGIQKAIMMNNADTQKNLEFSRFIDLSIANRMLIDQVKLVWPKEFVALCEKINELRKRKAIELFNASVPMALADRANTYRLMLMNEYMPVVNCWQTEAAFTKFWFWQYCPEIRTKMLKEQGLRQQLDVLVTAAETAKTSCEAAVKELGTIVLNETNAKFHEFSRTGSAALASCKNALAACKIARNQKKLAACKTLSKECQAQVTICQLQVNNARSHKTQQTAKVIENLVTAAINAANKAHQLANDAQRIATQKSGNTAAKKAAKKAKKAAKKAMAAAQKAAAARGTDDLAQIIKHKKAAASARDVARRQRDIAKAAK